MEFWLDTGTVVIAVAMIWFSYHKGLIRSVIELAGYVASFLAACALCVPAGSWLSDRFFAPMLKSAVSANIGSVTSGAQQTAEGILSKYGLALPQAAVASVAGAQNSIGVQISQAVATAVGQVIGRGAAFLLIFILCIVIVKWVARMSDVVFRVPLLGTVNRFGGAAIGAVKAALLIFVICTVVAALLPVESITKNPAFTAATINHTWFFRYFYQVNPFRGILLKS